MDDLLLSKIMLKTADKVREFAENIFNTVLEHFLALDQDLRAGRRSHTCFKNTARLGDYHD